MFLNKIHLRLNWIIIIILFLLLIPFIALFFFANPQLDDYCFSYLAKHSGFIGSQITYYQTWSGRYFTTALSSFNPLVFNSFNGYKIIAPLLLSGMFTSIFVFFHYTFKKYFKFEKQIILTLSTLIVYILGMPSVSQGIYWMSSSFTYQLGNIFTLLTFTILLNFNKINTNRNRLIVAGLGVFSIIATIGSDEICMLFACAISLGFVLYALIKKLKNRKYYILFFVVALIFTVIEYAAPGNAVRMGSIVAVHQKDFIYALTNSFSYSLQFIMDSIRWVLVPFTIILLPLTLFKGGLKRYNYINIAIGYISFILGCSALIWISIFPSFWIAGIGPELRVLNIPYFIFIIAYIGTVIFLSSILQKLSTKYIKSSNLLILKVIGLVIFLILMGIYPFKSASDSNLNLAMDDLISGKAYNYNNAMNDRQKIVKSQSSEELINIPKLQYTPLSLIYGDLGSKDGFQNSCYSSYMNVKAVQIEQPK